MTSNRTNTNSTSSNSVYLVLQRYRSCKILINETEWVTQGLGMDVNNSDAAIDIDVQQQQHDATGIHQKSHCGLLIYISFANTTDHKSCIEAAETCCNIPILTAGLWGDNTSPLLSLKQILLRTIDDNQHDKVLLLQTSVTIVPQANLICKVKSHGSSIQYHNQIDKDQGRQYYDLFVNCIRANVYEWSCTASQQDLPQSFMEWKAHHITRIETNATSSLSLSTTQLSISEMKFDPSIPPKDIFRTTTPNRYGSYDDSTGLPTTDIHQIPITKSALKKLCKFQELHRMKHEKYLLSLPTQNHAEETAVHKVITVIDDIPSCRTDAILSDTNKDGMVYSPPPPLPMDISPMSTTVCNVVVAGTFGKRQGIAIISDMGPFCHIVQI